MRKNVTKVRMLYNEIEALRSAYDMVQDTFEAENEHEHLLKAHSALMLKRMEHMYSKGQTRYTLHLSDVDVLSFSQLWPLYKHTLGRYEGAVVQKVLSHISGEFTTQSSRRRMATEKH